MKSPVEEVLEYYPLPFTLREDQVETINTLCGWGRNGCFYPVGGGKTVIATMVALYWALQCRVDQIIVMCPPILLTQWATWLASFEGVEVTNYKGTPAKRKKLSFDVDCIVTTPGLFKNDYERFMDYFTDKKVFLIVDEATVVRQCETLSHKAVRDFMNTGQKMLSLLTGTEISAPFQAYGYIKLITPDVYRDYRYFTLVHIVRLDQYKTPSAYQNLELMSENLLRQAVRKESHEIMDLPPVTYVPMHYDLDSKHKRLYDKVVDEKLVELDDGTILDGLLPQRMRMTCQRVIMSPAEFEGGNIQPAGFKLVDAMLSELGKEKLMIFSNFHTSNESVHDYCLGLGVDAALVYGGSRRTAKRNQDEIRRFIDDKDCQVLVGNPRSCGVGVDGIQHVCQAMLFLELVPFDYFEQAVGRIVRSGQKWNCVVWLAIANGTIQVEMARKAITKEDLAKEVVQTKAMLRVALKGG